MAKKSQAKSKAQQETTLVAFLLDRTGSMASVKTETVSGFNGYLDELLKRPETAAIRFHFTQFDSISVDCIHDCVPLKDVKRLTDATFEPRAYTPLYDAIGKTIRAIGDKAAKMKAKVLFVTLTDGQENASSEWNSQTIKTLIKEKEDKDKWTFSYIGVGPDAWAANAQLAAGTIGASNVLRATRGQNTQKAYQHLAGATMARCCAAGGQSLGNVYGGAQLDKDDEPKA